MSGTREQKIATIMRLFDAFGEGRWDDPAYTLAALADDATWWVAGSTRASGCFTKAQMMAGLRSVAKISSAGLAMTPRSWLVEGDRVAVEVDSTMPLRDGRCYRNQYHFAITLRGDRIASLREYMDTQHLVDIMLGPAPQSAEKNS